MLTKISMWHDQHGWKHITADVAAQLYPYGLSKDSRIFLCEICNQYAALARGAQRTFFTHTRDSKYCEQKISSHGDCHITNPLEFSLPLCVKFMDNSVDVSIGFLPLPFDLISRAENDNAQVSISTQDSCLGTYSINPLRFDPNRITYFSVGDKISEQYRLAFRMNDIKLSKRINYYWPVYIDGINRDGTLFDADSGKRLPPNADVVINRKYLVITQRALFTSYDDVYVEQLRLIGRYKVYKVCAKSMSRQADEFFRRYGGRLTDSPAELVEVYPFAIKSSHLLLYSAEQAWFYKSDGFIDIYPSNRSLGHKRHIFSVRGSFDQILSLSRFENRTSVLRYVMLRKIDENDMPHLSRNPKAQVKNDKHESIVAGVYSALPVGRVLSVDVEYDGFIDVMQGDSIVNRVVLKGGERFPLDVEWNRIYRIYQGLDLVYELTFTSEKSIDAMSDAQVFSKLISYTGQMMTITHAFGVVAARLGDMPKTKAWLATQIHKGQIDRRAKAYIQQICGR